MKAFLEIIRPVNCMMAAIAVYIAMFIASGNIFNLNFYAMGAAFFICASGIVINDYFDVDIDKVNKPKRPIPSGRISKNTALVYTGILFVIGNAAAFIISVPVFLFALFNSVVEITYAGYGKKIALVGNIMVSWLVGSLFIFGGLVIGNIVIVLILAMLAFLANVSREVYKTCEDIHGDIKHGARTIAVRYGRETAEKIGAGFIIIPVLLSFLPVYLGVLNVYYLYVVLVADIIFIASIIKNNIASKLIKYGMIVALIAFIVGAI